MAFGVSLFVPAKDVPETTYDESETLPYVSTSVASVLRPEVAVLASNGKTALAWLHLGSRRRFVQDRWASLPYPICDSLTILDHSLRC